MNTFYIILVTLAVYFFINVFVLKLRFDKPGNFISIGQYYKCVITSAKAFIYHLASIPVSIYLSLHLISH